MMDNKERTRLREAIDRKKRELLDLELREAAADTSDDFNEYADRYTSARKEYEECVEMMAEVVEREIKRHNTPIRAIAKRLGISRQRLHKILPKS